MSAGGHLVVIVGDTAREPVIHTLYEILRTELNVVIADLVVSWDLVCYAFVQSMISMAEVGHWVQLEGGGSCVLGHHHSCPIREPVRRHCPSPMVLVWPPSPLGQLVVDLVVPVSQDHTEHPQERNIGCQCGSCLGAVRPQDRAEHGHAAQSRGAGAAALHAPGRRAQEPVQQPGHARRPGRVGAHMPRGGFRLARPLPARRWPSRSRVMTLTGPGAAGRAGHARQVAICRPRFARCWDIKRARDHARFGAVCVCVRTAGAPPPRPPQRQRRCSVEPAITARFQWWAGAARPSAARLRARLPGYRRAGHCVCSVGVCAARQCPCSILVPASPGCSCVTALLQEGGVGGGFRQQRGCSVSAVQLCLQSRVSRRFRLLRGKWGGGCTPARWLLVVSTSTPQPQHSWWRLVCGPGSLLLHCCHVVLALLLWSSLLR